LTGVIALCLDLLVFENQAEVTRSSQANGLAELGVIYIGTKLEQKRVGLPPAQGLLVTEVKAGGPAEQAGLRPGDLITAINGKPLEPTDSLLAVLANNRPGDRVVLTVVRQNETLKLEVTLSELR
jgi:S1-C subfamily serine protease